MSQNSPGKDFFQTEPAGVVNDVWRRTAKIRLRFELGGLAFACKHGFTSEDYARHFFSKGALTWMGKDNPEPVEYLLREVRAFQEFYPEVSFRIVATRPGGAYFHQRLSWRLRV